MKKWFCFFILININAVAAKNWPLQGAIPHAKAEVLAINGVTEGDWQGFLAFITPKFESTATKNEQEYKKWLVSEFDKWKSNTLLHTEDALDEETRKAFDPAAAYNDSTTLASPPRSFGRGSIPSASTLSTRAFAASGHSIARTEACIAELKTIRNALNLNLPESREGLRDRLEASVTAQEPTLKELFGSDDLRTSYIKVLLEDGAHRDQVLAAINDPANGAFRTVFIQNLLENPDSRAQILDALHGPHSQEMIDKIHGGDHRQDMVRKLHGDEGSRRDVVADLSANYAGDIVAKVVESHRPAVLDALIPAHTADFVPKLENEPFRTNMINGLLAGAAHMGSIVERLDENEVFRGAVLARLIANGAHREAIAGRFVEDEPFRTVLIHQLEVDRFAIAATRMLWHTVDGEDPHAAFWGALNDNVIVTTTAFNHLLGKTRDGYQAIKHLTGQRENFRWAFERGNRVGKDRSHLGSAAV